MESYLKGRKQTHRYNAHLPAPHARANDNNGEAGEEEVIAAEALPDAVNAPAVDLVMRDGVVCTIIIHLPDDQRLELECDYGEG